MSQPVLYRRSFRRNREPWGLPSEHRPDWREHVGERRPVLIIDAEGTIQYMTPTACRRLGYPEAEEVEPDFFKHIHDQDVNRVMWDLADMACRGRQQATWRVRLKTAQGEWERYTICATNHLRRRTASGIELQLCEHESESSQ